MRSLSFPSLWPAQTPFDSSSFLVPTVERDEIFDQEEYQAIVGSLIYLSSRTRPDISYAGIKISQFSSKQQNSIGLQRKESYVT